MNARLRLVAALLPPLALFAACGAGAVPPWQQPPQLDVDLRVQVAPQQVGVMQPVTITLDRYRRQGVDVAFEPEVDEASWLETGRVVAEERPFGDGLWQRTVLTVLPLREPGACTIAPFVATAGEGDGAKQATTPEQTVEVTTALAGFDAETIEPPGPPIEAAGSPWLWFGVVYGAILLVVAASFVTRRGRARPLALEVALPPHVKALRALQRWQQAPRRSQAEVDAFYVGVSQVLRVYLEERFALRAPERTTDEFLRELDGDGDGDLARRHRGELERFLRQCDLVKFAAHVPAAQEHDEALRLAERFVESTRPDRQDAAVEEVAS